MPERIDSLADLVLTVRASAPRNDDGAVNIVEVVELGSTEPCSFSDFAPSF